MFSTMTGVLILSKMQEIFMTSFRQLRKTLVEIHGSSLVKIQGAGGILLYTENEIRISLREKGSFLCVLGHGLCCNSYNMGAVGIEGKIRSVSFCHGEKEEENER